MSLTAWPLAGGVLDVGETADFVIAEWADDGSAPGQLIAPPMGWAATDRRSKRSTERIG